MTRTLATTLLLALLAAPMALAQHGPPPAYTDPTQYAVDYAAAQADNATSDPAGYAQGLDPAAEAEHALWLACWQAYELAGDTLDPACSQFFTAPVTVHPHAQGIAANVTQVLDDTGVSGLATEVLDIANDTLADPATALDQVKRAVQAVVRFVEDLLGFLGDALGVGALALAAGLIGAVQGLLDLLALPLAGLGLAGNGLADVGGALATLLGLVGSGLATASSTAGAAVLDGVSAAFEALGRMAESTADRVLAAVGAVGAAVQAAFTGVGDAALAAGQGIGDAVGATVSGIGDGAQAIASAVGDAADAVRDGVDAALDRVGSLFDGKEKRPAADRSGLPDAPRTGTGVDGLIDGLLDAV